VRDGAIIGEGYHHRAGAPHAEIEALRAAGDAKGATLYVTLEPCAHTGRTPPCAPALVAAQIARVVIGTRDPNPMTAGAGIAILTAAGIATEVVDAPEAFELVESFAIAVRNKKRPYVALKLACSMDGFVASHSGESRWLTGRQARSFVRELRIEHDAVMVGAGTIRVDNPLLTVRPPHDRARPYDRVVVCETDLVSPTSSVFEPVVGYRRTIVLAPAGCRELFSLLEGVADVVYVGTDRDFHLDLASALHSLRDRDIQSVLCEGGPTLAAHLLEARCVDRVYWLTAPLKLAAPGAVPALVRDANLMLPSIEFERVEALGNDMLATGLVHNV
jgi:diaminohydroxyphosphoribosylaminopyrimidine deaminase / 5-amino-6-(5-phosphoribosylamino)uracil reductase